jgi:cytochrome P450
MTDNLDLFLGDPRNIADAVFFPGIDRIREEDPVFFSPSQHVWFLTRHEDVIQCFSDARWSEKRLQGSQFAAFTEDEKKSLIPNLVRYVPDWVNNIDSPQHDRVRRLLLRGFTRKVIDSVRPDIERFCDALVDMALEKREFDFVDDVAFPLPAQVIMKLLGVPSEHIGKMRPWANVVTAALAGVQPSREILLAAEQAFAEMNAIFMIEIEKRKTAPGNDLISALVQAREDNGDALTLEELLGILQLVIIAGHDSTANSIGLGLLAMLNHPEQMQAYKEGKVDGMQAMYELLRHVNVSAMQPRVAHVDMELRGKQIKAGQYAFVMIAAANRDPRMFENPTVMNFSRPRIDRVAVFGPGFHHCVGHQLARIELDCLFRRLVDRVSKMEADTSDLRFQPNPVFRGLESLPVRFTA